MKTLIISVFAPTKRNKVWIDLQKEYICNTYGEYEFIAYLAPGTNTAPFERADVKFIKAKHKKTDFISRDHANNLSDVLKIIKEKDFNFGLILDSDCFPITKNWNEILRKAIKKKNKKYAAPIRSENMTISAHPSAFFFKKTSLDCLDFSVGKMINLWNGSCTDVGGKISISSTFPLLRSNCVNLHPILAGIYGNLFYHHGAGSRNDGANSWADQYHELLSIPKLNDVKLFNMLKNNTKEFIERLCGKELNGQLFL